MAEEAPHYGPVRIFTPRPPLQMGNNRKVLN